MVFCANCGTELDDDDEFCPECGTRNEDFVEPQPVEEAVKHEPAAGAPGSPPEKQKTVFEFVNKSGYKLWLAMIYWADTGGAGGLTRYKAGWWDLETGKTTTATKEGVINQDGCYGVHAYAGDLATLTWGDGAAGEFPVTGDKFTDQVDTKYNTGRKPPTVKFTKVKIDGPLGQPVTKKQSYTFGPENVTTWETKFEFVNKTGYELSFAMTYWANTGGAGGLTRYKAGWWILQTGETKTVTKKCVINQDGFYGVHAECQVLFTTLTWGDGGAGEFPVTGDIFTDQVDTKYDPGRKPRTARFTKVKINGPLGQPVIQKQVYTFSPDTFSPARKK
jgi:hypothetical protein